DRLVEEGRFLFEEASCVRCHMPKAVVEPMKKDPLLEGLAWREGPDLSRIGARAHAGWIDRWLASPQKMRPGAAMPEMFGSDETGRAERYAVAHYLAALGGPVRTNPKPPNEKDLAASVRRGQKLFNSVGCIACHNPDGKSGDAAAF